MLSRAIKRCARGPKDEYPLLFTRKNELSIRPQKKSWLVQDETLDPSLAASHTIDLLKEIAPNPLRNHPKATPSLHKVRNVLPMQFLRHSVSVSPLMKVVSQRSASNNGTLDEYRTSITASIMTDNIVLSSTKSQH